MLLFISSHKNLQNYNLYFNTSHVTVYPKRQCVHFVTYLIFQYISCYCLSKMEQTARCILFHFNTSHVTVYQQYETNIKNRAKFQYISCYCLSEKIVRSKEVKEHFNTSHVTVYQQNVRTA